MDPLPSKIPNDISLLAPIPWHLQVTYLLMHAIMHLHLAPCSISTCWTSYMHMHCTHAWAPYMHMYCTHACAPYTCTCIAHMHGHLAYVPLMSMCLALSAYVMGTLHTSHVYVPCSISICHGHLTYLSCLCALLYQHMSWASYIPLMSMYLAL